MGHGELLFDFVAFCSRHQAPEKLTEIEADRDVIHPDQAGDMFDMIDITIEGRFLLFRTNENGVHPDDAPASADHFDLFVTDVALNVVVTTNIGVGNNQRPFRQAADLFKTSGVDVGQVEDDPEAFALRNQLAPKVR